VDPPFRRSGDGSFAAHRRERPHDSYRFLEFFIPKIRNAHTRRASTRAAEEFF
jgi:hypothetical protein